MNAHKVNFIFVNFFFFFSLAASLKCYDCNDCETCDKETEKCKVVTCLANDKYCSSGLVRNRWTKGCVVDSKESCGNEGVSNCYVCKTDQCNGKPNNEAPSVPPSPPSLKCYDCNDCKTCKKETEKCKVVTCPANHKYCSSGLVGNRWTKGCVVDSNESCGNEGVSNCYVCKTDQCNGKPTNDAPSVPPSPPSLLFFLLFIPLLFFSTKF